MIAILKKDGTHDVVHDFMLHPHDMKATINGRTVYIPINFWLGGVKPKDLNEAMTARAAAPAQTRQDVDDDAGARNHHEHAK